MQGYLARRALLVFPTLFLLSLFVFAIVRFFPGDIVVMLLQDHDFTPEQLAEERARLGLGLPLHEQYIVWAGSLLRGNLGNSLWTERPIVEDLEQKLPVTMELGLLSLVFGLAIALPVGILSAVRQDTALDYIMRGFAIGALSIPGFWLATMLILALSIWFNWIPPLRYVSFAEDPWANLQQFVFPALILGINLSGILMRMTRTTLLDVLRQDYIRTAWAKGLRERVVVYRHALKNALIPVVTILGVEVARVIGGSVVMETIFGLPGVGKYVFDVLLVRDYPAIQAVNLFLAAFIIVINLLVDMSHGYLDPRIRYR